MVDGAYGYLGLPTSSTAQPGYISTSSLYPIGEGPITYSEWVGSIANTMNANIVNGLSGYPSTWDKSKYGNWDRFSGIGPEFGVDGYVYKNIVQWITDNPNDPFITQNWGAPPQKTNAEWVADPYIIAEQQAYEINQRNMALSEREQNFQEAKFAISVALDNASRSYSGGGGGGGGSVASRATMAASLQHDMALDYAKLALERELATGRMDLERAQLEADIAYKQNLIDIQRQELDQQGQQFSQQLAENQRQFDEQMAYQKEQDASQQALQLLSLQNQRAAELAQYGADPGDAIQRHLLLRARPEPVGTPVDAFSGSPTGDPTTLSNLMMQQADKFRPFVAGNTSNATPGTTTPGMAAGTDYYGRLPGYTTEDQFMVGDSLSGRPTGYEEMIENPTGAPIRVKPLNAQATNMSHSLSGNHVMGSAHADQPIEGPGRYSMLPRFATGTWGDLTTSSPGGWYGGNYLDPNISTEPVGEAKYATNEWGGVYEVGKVDPWASYFASLNNEPPPPPTSTTTTQPKTTTTTTQPSYGPGVLPAPTHANLQDPSLPRNADGSLNWQAMTTAQLQQLGIPLRSVSGSGPATHPDWMAMDQEQLAAFGRNVGTSGDTYNYAEPTAYSAANVVNDAQQRTYDYYNKLYSIPREQPQDEQVILDRIDRRIANGENRNVVINEEYLRAGLQPPDWLLNEQLTGYTPQTDVNGTIVEGSALPNQASSTVTVDTGAKQIIQGKEYTPVITGGQFTTPHGGAVIDVAPGDFIGPPDVFGQPTILRWNEASQQWFNPQWNPTIISSAEQFHSLPYETKQAIMSGNAPGYMINNAGAFDVEGRRGPVPNWFDTMYSRSTPVETGYTDEEFAALSPRDQLELYLGLSGLPGQFREYTEQRPSYADLATNLRGNPSGLSKPISFPTEVYEGFADYGPLMESNPNLEQDIYNYLVSNTPTPPQPTEKQMMGLPETAVQVVPPDGSNPGYNVYKLGRSYFVSTNGGYAQPVPPSLSEQFKTWVPGEPQAQTPPATGGTPQAGGGATSTGGGGASTGTTNTSGGGTQTGGTGTTTGGTGSGTGNQNTGGGTGTTTGGQETIFSTGNAQLDALLTQAGYSVISYGNETFQNLPALKYISGELTPEEYNMFSALPTEVPALGVTLPAPSTLNYGKLLELAQNDPTAFGVLQSLFRAGNRDLATEMAISKTYAPTGSAYQPTLISTG